MDSAEQEFAEPGLRFQIREDDVAWRRVVDDMVLLDVEHSVYHGLNRTGAIIWEGIAGGHSVAELIELVAEEFPDAAEQASSDVPRFLRALVDAGLITPVAQGATASGDAS
ncbi:MAG TPA: PqqD family protein [Acidimicrobiales bacterium]|jgi:hypothetical protein|nr:PqqD family protein [Acidimicrobiales bacterium]